MCVLVIISADHLLPDLEPWREGKVFGRSFEMGSGGTACPSTRAHAITVVAHAGCGCGFNYSHADEDFQRAQQEASVADWSDQDKASFLRAHEVAREQSLLGRRSVAALREYLRLAAAGGEVDVIVLPDRVWPIDPQINRQRVQHTFFAETHPHFAFTKPTVFTIEHS